MFKYLVTVIILLFVIPIVKGQSTADMSRFYNKKLIHLMTTLKYDSAKVYSINCKLENIEPLSISMDTPSVYFRRYNSKDSISYGKKLVKIDADRLIYLIKNMHKDAYAGDPIGQFYPSIGIVFFKNKRIIANIEYSPVSIGMSMRLKNSFKTIFESYWSVVGLNLDLHFDKMCKKYKLECCDFKKSLDYIYKRNRVKH
jgi:hypothetical protein